MANTRSAKKNIVKNEKRRLCNLTRLSTIKTMVKKLDVLIKTTASAEQLDQMLSQLSAKLSRASGKRVIHHNTASRKLSRLAKRVAVCKRTSQEAKAVVH